MIKLVFQESNLKRLSHGILEHWNCLSVKLELDWCQHICIILANFILHLRLKFCKAIIFSRNYRLFHPFPIFQECFPQKLFTKIIFLLKLAHWYFRWRFFFINASVISQTEGKMKVIRWKNCLSHWYTANANAISVSNATLLFWRKAFK